MIFLNVDATNINDIFLNEEWSLEKLPEIENIYAISVNGNRIDWLVKKYKTEKHAKYEINILQKLKRIDNIPKILAVNLSAKISYIILSKFPGMDLYTYVQATPSGVPENEAKNIIKQILITLKKIHSKNIIHLDIKPENIIYNKNTYKVYLIDFEDKQTREYSSPEQSKGYCKLTPKTDIWSLGITLCFILTKKQPPKVLSFPKNWSVNLKDFISCLLEPDVDIRYSVREALNHSWLDS